MRIFNWPGENGMNQIWMRNIYAMAFTNLTLFQVNVLRCTLTSHCIGRMYQSLCNWCAHNSLLFINWIAMSKPNSCNVMVEMDEPRNMSESEMEWEMPWSSEHLNQTTHTFSSHFSAVLFLLNGVQRVYCKRNAPNGVCLILGIPCWFRLLHANLSFFVQQQRTTNVKQI